MKSRNVKLWGLLAVAALALAAMAPMASGATPAPGYSQFAGCPSPAENPIISSCLRSTVKSGNFKMGNKDVPITNPIVVSGGTDENLQNFSFNSKGGMSKSPQKVPGGVVGLTGLTWLLEILGSEALTLYATTELAGTPQFLGINLIKLPIKVHLENATLGKNCYVGSNASPISLNLTTGTSGKLTGVVPKFKFQPSPEILFVENGKYVDGTFAAPGASGCVLTLFGFIPISINGLVNTASGLPAATGNETTQNILTEIAASEVVYP